jgi:hypothetical protein
MVLLAECRESESLTPQSFMYMKLWELDPAYSRRLIGYAISTGLDTTLTAGVGSPDQRPGRENAAMPRSIQQLPRRQGGKQRAPDPADA